MVSTIARLEEAVYISHVMTRAGKYYYVVFFTGEVYSFERDIYQELLPKQAIDFWDRYDKLIREQGKEITNGSH